MKLHRSVLISILVSLLVACGGGATASTPPPPPAPAPPPPPPPSPGPTESDLLAEELEGLGLEEFYEVSFAALVMRDPEEIVSNFLTDVFPLDDVGLNDLSQVYATETFAMYRVVQDMLVTYDREALDAESKVSYDVYQWYLQD
jgi:hypothetical protein